MLSNVKTGFLHTVITLFVAAQQGGIKAATWEFTFLSKVALVKGQ